MDGELMAVLAWKPYASLEETQKAIEKLEEKPTIASHKYYLALPTQYLSRLAQQNTSDHLVFGATGMNSVAPGTFTSAVAGKLLKQLGAEFVLLGTAYSRQLGDRDHEAIRLKILKAIEAGLVPILCIGETIRDFESGRSEQILEKQLSESLKGFGDPEFKVLKIIYEAPWINATAQMPSWETLNRAYQGCRELVKRVCGVRIPVLCGVPDDILDLVDFVESVQAEGYFFSHASFHLDLFSKGLHLALPGTSPAAEEEHVSKEAEKEVETAPAPQLQVAEKQVTEKKVEEPEEQAEEVAGIVETAVLAAAQEVEESEVAEEPKTLEQSLETIQGKEKGAEIEEEEAVEEKGKAPEAPEEVEKEEIEAPEAAREVVEEEIEEVPEVSEEVVEEEVLEEEKSVEAAPEKKRRRVGISDISKTTKERRKLEEEEL